MNTKQKSSATNKKARISINLIDIITVIALIVALTAAGFGIYSSLSSGGEQVRIRYIIESDPMDDSFTSKVSAEDGIFDPESARQIGKVYSVSAVSAEHVASAKDAALSVEGKSVLHITADTTAVKTATGYVAGGTLISIGRQLELRMPNLFCTGKCISIEIITE